MISESRRINPKRPHCIVVGGSGWLGHQLQTRMEFAGLRTQTVAPADVLLLSGAYRELLELGTEVIVNCSPPLKDEEGVYSERLESALVGGLQEGLRRSEARLIHIGSAAEYAPSDSPLQESSDLGPVSAYGRAKEFSSRSIAAMCEQGGHSLAMFRPFTLVGPDPHRGMLIGDLIRRLTEARRSSGVLVLDDASCVRDLTGSDVVAGCIARAVSSSSTLPPVINICSGRGWSINELATHLCERVPEDIEVVDQGEVSLPRQVIGSPVLLEETLGISENRSLDPLLDLAMPRQHPRWS